MDKDVIKKKRFKEIDLNDSFFDSLKDNYPKFEEWYLKKIGNEEEAFVLYDNGIKGFLYLKEENEEDRCIKPPLELGRRLKVGTFKIEAHGTKLGERFVKIIIDEIYKSNFKEAYVTIFPKHKSLVDLLTRYGFVYHGIKESIVGIEDVYIKNINTIHNNLFLDYPKINLKGNNKLLLSIWPKFHTRMFPDSKLITEKDHYVENVSFTNSIEKIYLSGAPNLNNYKKGDLLVIYRTAETYGRAKYESVATSICVIEDIKHISEFSCYDDFLDYCIKYSIFDEKELKGFWRDEKYPYLIRMLYNIALNKRPIRKRLMEEAGLDGKERWTSLPLTDEQFLKILELGDINENLIID